MQSHLTAKELKIVEEWFSRKELKPCSACGAGDKWAAEGTLGVVPGYFPKLEMSIIPAVILTCRNCGHIVSFNAKLMGIER